MAVQPTAAAHFRFVALVSFIHPFCRPRPLPAAVADLLRWPAPQIL
jgi:hypothetical protein